MLVKRATDDTERSHRKDKCFSVAFKSISQKKHILVVMIWTLLDINVILEKKAIRNIHELCQELFVCGLKIL